MRYLLKVGSQYLGVDGQITTSQADAIKVDLPDAKSLRAVRLVPRRDRSTSSGYDPASDAGVSPV
jgi:hypothetical protein